MKMRDVRELKLSKFILNLLIYVFLFALANQGGAREYDFAAINSLKGEELKALIVHQELRDASTETFVDPDGKVVSLGDFRGQVVVLNFWATWCAPCRKEMPTLDNLQGMFAPGTVKVIAVHAGPSQRNDTDRFWADARIRNIESYYDSRLKFASSMGTLGLPTTVLITRDGHEFARLLGDVEWDQEAVVRILTTMAGD